MVFGGHVMRLTLNVCLCGGRWGLRAAVIPPWDLKSALFIPPWELKDALLIPSWHLKSAVFILHGTSRVLSLSPTGPHGCSYPPWGFTGAPFTALPTPQYLLGTLILLHGTSRAILVVLLCRSRLVCHPAGDTGHYPWCRRGHFLLLGELCSSYVDSSCKLE